MKVKLENSKETKDIVIYQSDDGVVSFNVSVFEETVWLTQEELSLLFQKAKSTINEHIKNIYSEEELEEAGTMKKFGNSEFQNKAPHYYNLDMIISVGYRVKSQRGIQFRRWATKVLKQYMLNGYAVNEVRVKQIESSIELLVASDKVQTKEIAEIKDLLKRLIERPIIINNHNHNHNKFDLVNNDLETKVIELLDCIIEALQENNKAKTHLEEVKQDIAKYQDNPKARTRLKGFFKEIGDTNSDINKVIKGAGITKSIITELIKLCNKLKDLF